MMTMTLPETNGSSAAISPKPWLQWSVQKFFSTFNWEDNPPEVQELKRTSQDGDSPLSLTLSVCQFFASVNWEGATIAAPTPMPPVSAPTAKTELTLDDFSNLF